MTISDADHRMDVFQDTIFPSRGHWKLYPESDKLFLCPVISKMLSLSSAVEFGAKQMCKFIDLPYIRSVGNWLRGLKSGRMLTPIRFRVRTLRNEYRWIQLAGSYYPELWDEGDMILGTAEDVTDIKNEEQATFSILNHEIRNPLAVIKLNAQLLNKTMGAAEKVFPGSLTEGIVHNIDAITSLLDRYLLDKTSISSGMTEFDLGILMEETLSNFERLHPGHSFFVRGDLKCLVRADRFQIAQVLINYLGNAVKFSPEGSRITVLLKRGANRIELSVADEGIGIPEEFQKRVFERYFKIAPKLDSQGTSKGLGLFLIKQIIEEHRGKVWVQRSRSGGSIFFFSLPELYLHN